MGHAVKCEHEQSLLSSLEERGDVLLPKRRTLYVQGLRVLPQPEGILPVSNRVHDKSSHKAGRAI